MKQIRVLRSTGTTLPQYTEGQVVEVQDDVADHLCRLGLATVMKAIPDEPIQAIPELPTITADASSESSDGESAESRHPKKRKSQSRPEHREK